MTTLSPELEALRDLPTPCLVVDAACLERNIKRMAAAARAAGVTLRPHAKTHKSKDIARLQLEAGATGIACATVTEAEFLAHAGIERLLLTSPVMGTDKFRRLAQLNRTYGLTTVIDHPLQLKGLRQAMQPGDRTFPVAVDVDVGQERTGVTAIRDAVQLARMIVEQPEFTFVGIQGFAGHAQHIIDPTARRTAADAAATILREVSEALDEAGMPATLITGSGTGTYDRDTVGPYTELQVGSYVFMDADYSRIECEQGQAFGFEPSLFILATVVSANRKGQVTVDAGSKALATNGPPPAIIIGAPLGASYRFAGDEHGIIITPRGEQMPPLGGRLLIGATHCDPTVNLHSTYHVVRNDAVNKWPIRGRYTE